MYNLHIHGGEYSCKKCGHAVASLVDMNTQNEDINLGYQELLQRAGSKFENFHSRQWGSLFPVFVVMVFGLPLQDLNSQPLDQQAVTLYSSYRL